MACLVSFIFLSSVKHNAQHWSCKININKNLIDTRRCMSEWVDEWVIDGVTRCINMLVSE